jgi:2-polyprenyl-6-methoxyphenol hydroxylase-like FAD-dependent oxidoreductase
MSVPTKTGDPALYDVAVVGGGLSGTLAATVLGRAGYRVALIDRHAVYPSEFRVEKIGGDQIQKLQGLGLLDALEAAATPFQEIVNVRRGRVLDRTHAIHYGIFYEDLVRTMRAQLPETVHFIVGRVDDLCTGPDVQTVSITEQASVAARLVVLASGMGDLLRRKLGIERNVVHAQQSLTFGFNIRPSGSEAFRYPALTYYGERPSDGIDYLNLFPAGGLMRANLFTFLDHRNPWVKEFRQSPRETLGRTLPGLASVLGDFEVVGGVQNWLMDLSVAQDVRQDGVVLIGDSYQTSCPAAGTGVSRLLTDVERLCTVHIPDWLESPQMRADKLARFYDDPDKQAMDARALGLAHYRRSLTVDTSLNWRTRRQVMYVRRRMMSGLDRISPSLAARLRKARAARA